MTMNMQEISIPAASETMAAPVQNVMEGEHKSVVEVPVGELTPVLAVCCAFYSLNLKTPECIGCSGKETYLCLQGDVQCCKLPDPETEKGVILSCCRQDCNVVMPYTCCERRGEQQCPIQ